MARPMAAFDLDAYVGRSRALDMSAIPRDEVARHPVPPEAIRTLRYMQDIESHTIIYLRALPATRAIDDPEVATFLACRLYEETFHGIALARFLEAAGHPVGEHAEPRGREPITKRIEAAATAMLSKAWPDFCAVHIRLQRARLARVARLLVDRFWAPVGSGVQPDRELVFMARYLRKPVEPWELCRTIGRLRRGGPV